MTGLRVDGVFDIETENWDRFVLGGIMDASGVYRSTSDEDQLVEWLLCAGGHYWTWNGGLYDSLWLAEQLRRKGARFTCNLAGPRVTRLECEGLVVRDAVALIPMTLQKAARIAGIELSKDTGLPCRCKEACGGYCSIRRGMPAAQLKRLDAYLRLDCRASLAALQAVSAEAERCGYVLAGTVGGSSYQTLSGFAEVEKADWPDAETYKIARSGYYGGRVEVFRPKAARGFAYDINSAYPAALTRVALPVGPRLRVSGAKAARAYRRGKEGIYLARVRVPDDAHLPPLPYRTGSGRVVYPVGPFKGAWTGLELRAAEERGCTAKVDSALVWGDSEPVMATALLIGWQNRARAAAEGNASLATWHKWFCNSFTGKLAEAPEKQRVICNPADDEVKICSCRWKPRGANRCRCGAFWPLDKEGRLWSSPFWRLSSCAHVHWAAYLTAWTRVTLLAQLEADGQGGKTAVYCDTDSVKAIAPRDQGDPDELGGWKDEGAFEDFCAIAPKVYRYRTAAGEVEVRGKGLPGLDAAGFARFATGAPHRVSRGVRALRSAGRSGGSLFVRKELERSSHADGVHFGGRILRRDGITYPQTLKEIARWENQL